MTTMLIRGFRKPVSALSGELYPASGIFNNHGGQDKPKATKGTLPTAKLNTT